ncbi:MAG: hypothetical protein LJE84_04255 [Gammaproteobacteria bacterium]|nr:hypothetical protein [Gammaproteobacteria bacterium]
MRYRTLIILASAGLLAACATISTPPQKTLNVISDVSADCTFQDKLGQREFVAPGDVAAQPRHGPGTLTCNKGGYRTATVTVEPQANSAVMGNLLVGGLIGLAVDSASGANKRYPKDVHVFMEPERFENDEAREAWFAARQRTLDEYREQMAPKDKTDK